MCVCEFLYFMLRVQDLLAYLSLIAQDKAYSFLVVSVPFTRE